ncbi:MAG: response regulator, partial [Calditrichia bacterium]
MEHKTLKILLIDDDEDDYVIVRDMFQDFSHRRFKLEWVNTFEDGLKKLKEDKHDVFLLDYRLDGFDGRNGIELLQEARRNKQEKPIIFLTGQETLELDYQAMKVGASDFLVKDQITPPLLERSIRYAVERKGAEVSLKRQKELLQTIIDNIPLMLILIDAEGHIKWVNNEVKKLDLEQDIKAFSDFISACYPDKLVRQRVTDHLNSGEMQWSDYPLFTKDGTILTSWCYARLSDQSVLAIGLDITKRKKIEQELQEKEQLLTNILEVLPVGVWITDRDGKIISANRAAVALWDGVRYVGKEDYNTYKSFWAETGRKLENTENALFQAVSEGKRSIGQMLEIETFENHRKVVIHSAVPVHDEQGEFRAAVVVNEDITQIIRQEQAIRESEQRLKELNSKIISAQENERKRVAQEIHDSIGQSLVAIKFTAEKSLAQLSSGKSIDFENVLHNLADKTSDTIEEVQRIQQNLRPPILDNFGLLSTIEWFIEEFQSIYNHIEVDDHLRIQEEEIPPPIKLVIFRIIQEALNNTAKHSKANLVSVSLKQENGYINLEIEDDGIGFNREKILRKKSFMGLGL